MDRTQYQPTPSEPLSETVVYAVAETNGVDPMALSERLYDCIDPDALDRLFRTGRHGSGGTVVFTMAGCRVTVEDGGAVVVTEPVDEADAHETVA
jgi:hypothetical protein